MDNMASWIYSDTGRWTVYTMTRHFYVWPDKSIIEFSNAHKSTYWVNPLAPAGDVAPVLHFSLAVRPARNGTPALV